MESRIERITESGCWIWNGEVTPSGYGRAHIKGKRYMAHRLLYKLNIGKIPQELQLDHLCRVRCCVNPSHLEVVTVKENVLRGVGLTAINARKTHCQHGHEFTPENTIHTISGKSKSRMCRTCAVEATRRWRLNRRKDAQKETHP